MYIVVERKRENEITRKNERKKEADKWSRPPDNLYDFSICKATFEWSIFYNVNYISSHTLSYKM